MTQLSSIAMLAAVDRQKGVGAGRMTALQACVASFLANKMLLDGNFWCIVIGLCMVSLLASIKKNLLQCKTLVG